ncbi:hydrogenase nickel incorporation protein HypB [Geoalkalibacter halelectricus]|uniref:Hydrogenase nickel incorporation protein HypB n=1 Tax=Geoalkalibacter halelectricus TaxID=2847045 RepID=A0ABY5ZIV9_9BACT|nr:hydrogenase nickel incorporation protein HypB [Geoalkalibacter halelectricus]MDO3377750.1 hydrogenase nickel incorporation protein HypB [Geoalkalibacter halelectricus]UWZ78656.1 hydrogenase nickel incorporation protein HypB [Geoalkalibacter halelectricus]
MCIDCGCGPTDHHHHHHEPGHAQDHGHDHGHSHDQGRRTLRIEEDILAKNNRLAGNNRARFGAKGLFVLNLVSSPGSGKTSILERTLRDLAGNIAFAVLEGDQQTDQDAARIAATGVPVHQINTGAGCHLDAHMVGHGVEHFDLDATDILMIENVGNLVCPAAFDLGEDHKVAVLSVTEGEDKPIKYPNMFHAADLLLINKIDLLPYLDFDLEKCKAYARQVKPDIQILEVSCKSGEGMEKWYAWLAQGANRKKT